MWFDTLNRGAVASSVDRAPGVCDQAAAYLWKEPSMEDLTLAVPGLWADHHVLAVLDLFEEEQGVTVVAASALDRSVRLSFDPQQTDAKRLTARLEDAGYDVGEAPPGEAPPPDKPAWASAGVRVTTTNPADLTMSGDHRKY